MSLRSDIFKSLNEKITAIAPDLTSTQLEAIVALVEPTGAQLLFTTMGGKSVQRLIRHYLYETGTGSRGAPGGRTNRAVVDARSWPTRPPEKERFTQFVKEVLAIPDRAVLEHRDHHIAKLKATIATLQTVSEFAAVMEAIEDLENDLERAVEKRTLFLENNPWLIVEADGKKPPMKKAARVMEDDEEEDDDTEDDDEFFDNAN